jgi:uncharacterized repeat protein (TIGR01451 family)
MCKAAKNKKTETGQRSNPATVLRLYLPHIARGPVYQLAAVAVAGALPLAAHAETPAGAQIINTAKASFTTGTGATASNTSNAVASTVAELIDIGVTSVEAKVNVRAGDTRSAIAFKVTNAGNAKETCALSADVALAGASFAPIFRQIVLDATGDGVLTAADPAYQPGVNDPTLAAGQSIVVWVEADMPASLPANASAGVALTCSVVNAPAGAVIGKSNGRGVAQSAYVASSLAVALAKSVSAGVAHPVAGTLLTYSLQASFTGAGTANGAAIADAIPAGSTYVAGSLRLDGATMTDAADGDPGRADQTGVSVTLGDVAAPAQHTVTFQVRINANGAS